MCMLGCERDLCGYGVAGGFRANEDVSHVRGMEDWG
jgi:hypothetical protein